MTTSTTSAKFRCLCLGCCWQWKSAGGKLFWLLSVLILAVQGRTGRCGAVQMVGSTWFVGAFIPNPVLRVYTAASCSTGSHKSRSCRCFPDISQRFMMGGLDGTDGKLPP